MIVECPHCKCDITIEDFDVEMMHNEGYIEDYECPECGEIMDISVEQVWSGEACEITKEKCDECGRDIRTRDLHYRRHCSPFPYEEKYDKLCANCFQKVLYAELDARKDYLLSLTSEDKVKIKETYLPGLLVHVNTVKDPYNAKRLHNFKCHIDHIKNECIVMCSLINGELIQLYPGYDDFYIVEEKHE